MFCFKKKCSWTIYHKPRTLGRTIICTLPAPYIKSCVYDAAVAFGEKLTIRHKQIKEDKKTDTEDYVKQTSNGNKALPFIRQFYNVNSIILNTSVMTTLNKPTSYSNIVS